MTALAILISLIVAEPAQTPGAAASQGPTFDVASVRLNKTGSQGVRTKFLPGGHFTATNITVRRLILMAYQIRDFQLAGGPSWIDSERYDIDAKAEEDSRNGLDNGPMTDERRKANSSRIFLMIQGLLAERFKVAVHKESNEGTVYWLVIGKNGLKIKEVRAASTDADAKGRPSVLTGGNGELHAEGIKLAELLGLFVEEVGRPVIDKTGLTGDYNLDLQWTPDHGRGDAPEPSNGGPSIFTALQEQVGLTLERHKAPVDLMVIDHVEKPAEN